MEVEILEHVFRAKQAEYLIAVLGLLSFMAFWRVLNGPALELDPVRAAARAMADRIAGFLVPENVLYHPGQAWARIGDDGLVTVGLTDFASKLVGRVDAFALPQEGHWLKQGAKGWAIESDARSVDMLSPVDGEVVAINAAALTSPQVAQADPYGQGWLLKIKATDLAANLKNLIPANMVQNWFEGIRESLNQYQAAPALAAVYQDGGVPVAGIAKALDSEHWDEIAAEYFLTDDAQDARVEAPAPLKSVAPRKSEAPLNSSRG